MHLKTDDFIRCGRSVAPENTLLYISNPVAMDDLQRYLDLVEAFFSLSPEGLFVCSAWSNVHMCIL